MDPVPLENLITDAPLLVRLVVGVLGAVVLLWGARIYKAAVAMASWGAGAIGAVALLHGLSGVAPELQEPLVLLVGAVIGGFAVMAVALVAHRLALVGIGALAGVVAAGAGAEIFAVGPLPLWAYLIGALVGGGLLPWLFPLLLRLTTPLVGAILVAWAAGWPEEPLVLAGLWLVGGLFQLGFGRRRRGKEPEA